MKRDLEKFRKILLDCEASAQKDFDFSMSFPDRYGRSVPHCSRSEEDEFHIELMADAGLVEFMTVPDIDGIMADEIVEFRVTNDGHDFLEAARDEGIWRQTKSKVAEVGGSVTIDFAKKIALGLLKEKLEKHTGLKL